jgi:hypothetical protein
VAPGQAAGGLGRPGPDGPVALGVPGPVPSAAPEADPAVPLPGDDPTTARGVVLGPRVRPRPAAGGHRPAGPVLEADPARPVDDRRGERR